LTRSGALLYGVPVHHTKPCMAPTLAEILDPEADQTEWLIEAPRARELERYLLMVGAVHRDPLTWQFKGTSLRWSAAPHSSRVPLLLKVGRGV